MATFSPEQIQAFLERIGYPSAHRELSAPSGELLHDLHWAHLRAVPFENLDIVRIRRPILLDPAALYGKIVEERRGGYCFEVNGLLAAVLSDLGFEVRRVMVQFIQEGGLSPAFDHLALIVSIVGDGAAGLGERNRWLVDVGSGRQAFPRPLRLVAGLEQHQPEVDTTYRLTRAGERWELATKVSDGEWAPWYTFDETERELVDFAERNTFFQTDPSSHFRQGPLATRSRPDGRVTVTGDRLIETVGGVRSERAITPEEADALLASEFGIVLPGVPDDELSPGTAR